MGCEGTVRIQQTHWELPPPDAADDLRIHHACAANMARQAGRSELESSHLHDQRKQRIRLLANVLIDMFQASLRPQEAEMLTTLADAA